MNLKEKEIELLRARLQDELRARAVLEKLLDEQKKKVEALQEQIEIRLNAGEE